MIPKSGNRFSEKIMRENEAAATSDDAVLGGRLLLRQPLKGHRVGHDAILLAAAVPARAGERAVDLGAGVGGAGLALARRIEGLNVTLVEIDSALCALAAHNATANQLDSRARTICADAEDAQAFAAGGLGAGSVDHVLMNPPFNDPRRQNVSPDPRRRLAHVGAPGLLARWAQTAATLLKPQAMLTLIWRADGLDEALLALGGYFGTIEILPVLPRPAAPAIRVLLRAVRGGDRPRRDYPALVLNDADGRPSAVAEAVLRAGGALMVTER